MRQDNSVGVVTGLLFVALFLVMVASLGGVTRMMHPPSNGYELAGSSSPAK